MQSNCPHITIPLPVPVKAGSNNLQLQAAYVPIPPPSPPTAPRNPLALEGVRSGTQEVQPFYRRVDQHGRPFGGENLLQARFSATFEKQITPRQETTLPATDARYKNQQRHFSPPYTRNREPKRDRRGENHHRGKSRVELGEGGRIREDFPRVPDFTPRGQSIAEIPPRQPVERNLDITDFPPPPPIPRLPTTNEVMEELREVTYQYVNCPDPNESAARRQRVLDGEAHGLMVETAARIIASAVENAGILPLQPAGEESMMMQTDFRAQASDQVVELPPEQATIPLPQSGEGRPPISKRRTATQRHLTGASTRKSKLTKP